MGIRIDPGGIPGSRTAPPEKPGPSDPLGSGRGPSRRRDAFPFGPRRLRAQMLHEPTFVIGQLGGNPNVGGHDRIPAFSGSVRQPLSGEPELLTRLGPRRNPHLDGTAGQGDVDGPSQRGSRHVQLDLAADLQGFAGRWRRNMDPHPQVAGSSPLWTRMADPAEPEHGAIVRPGGDRHVQGLWLNLDSAPRAVGAGRLGIDPRTAAAGARRADREESPRLTRPPAHVSCSVAGRTPGRGSLACARASTDVAGDGNLNRDGLYGAPRRLLPRQREIDLDVLAPTGGAGPPHPVSEEVSKDVSEA